MEVTTTESSKPIDINNGLGKVIITALVSAFIGVAMTWVAFYFQTKDSIQELNKTDAIHSEQIGKLTESIQTLTTKTAVIGVAPENLDKQIQDLNQRMIRVENQQDKMYSILIDLSKRK